MKPSLIERIQKKFADVLEPGADVFTTTSPIEATVDKANRIIKGVLGTEVVDEEGEVVLWRNMSFRYFPTAAKAMYYQHDYDSLPVATCRNLGKRGNGLFVVAYVLPTDFGNDLLTAIEHGAVAHFSGACVRTDSGKPTYDEQAQYPGCSMITREGWMLEGSFTGMPCNLQAMMSLVSKSLIKRSSAVTMGLDDTPVRKFYPTTETPLYHLNLETGFTFKLPSGGYS